MKRPEFDVRGSKFAVPLTINFEHCAGCFEKIFFPVSLLLFPEGSWLSGEPCQTAVSLIYNF
jgi:hypothetical protein